MNTTKNPNIWDRAWVPTWKYQTGITFLWCATYAVLLAFSSALNDGLCAVCFLTLLFSYPIFITGFVASAWKNALRETLTFFGSGALAIVVTVLLSYIKNGNDILEMLSLLMVALVSVGAWAILMWSACRSFWELPPKNHAICRTFLMSTVGMFVVCKITCSIDSSCNLSLFFVLVPFWLSFVLLLFMAWIAICVERKRSMKKNKTENKAEDETETTPSVVSWRAEACVAGCFGTLCYYVLCGFMFWGLVIFAPHMSDSRESVRECLKSVHVHVPETATWEKAIHAGFQDRYDCALLTMSAEDFARIQLPEGGSWEKPEDMLKVDLIYNDQFWTPAFTEEELKRDFEAGRVRIFNMSPQDSIPFPGGVACFDEKGENVRVWLCNRGI
ncbi:MAG: hypothetical protein Q4C70_07890 [Planctomycetia bacterium]|nr:hypothetical protein [Planctomycetia bacterium]